MLDLMDSGSDQGRVYRALVGNPRSSVGTLAAYTGLGADAARAALDELAAHGMVAEAGPGTWEANSPAEIAEAVLRRDTQRQADLRRTGFELEQLYRSARSDGGRYGALEVVAGSTEVLATMQRLQSSARREIRVIDRPPYFAPPAYYTDQERRQRERMADGIAYRTIYFEAAFDDAVAGPNMARMVQAGEQARTLAEPPLKLAIADDDLAVTILEADGPSGTRALLVHPSSLLTALSNVFETLWRLAVPVSALGVDAVADERDRSILTLMASGATDEAIARRLGLSRRTVVRRVAALLTRLGATTRFQAGVQAARRGWL